MSMFRLSGMYARHPGRAPKQPPARLEARVLNRTLKPKPADGSTHWSSYKLAAELGRHVSGASSPSGPVLCSRTQPGRCAKERAMNGAVRFFVTHGLHAGASIRLAQNRDVVIGNA